MGKASGLCRRDPGSNPGLPTESPLMGRLIQSRVHGLNAVVHVGGVWVQVPCEFGPGVGHLL